MTPGGTQGIAYRPEIDGLRAIAVMSVILCHAGVPWFPGGYLGVDLFFAISGYLITGILVRELEGGRFSIGRFYLRRIRRILPALMLVMALCLPFAFWLMLPDDLQLFGQSLIATSTFINNMLLSLLGTYWGPDIQFFPLMHTWSLGVEEQYYLLAPLVLWAAWRIGGRRGLIGTMLILMALSFWNALYLGGTRPNWGFYLITSRAWELGAGALVALIEPWVRPRVERRLAMGLVAAGLAVALVLMAITPYGLSPGRRSLALIGGGCLVLLLGTAEGPVGRLLTLRPVVWTGLISYSLYLFHQPVFAFLRLATLERPGVWTHLALVPLAFLLAWLSWRHVEQPFRDPARIRTRTVLLSMGGATLAMVAIGIALFQTRGADALRPAYAGYEALGRAQNMYYNHYGNRHFMVPLPERSDRTRLLVVGDSFSRDFINMVRENPGLAGYDLSLVVPPACIAVLPDLVAAAKTADFVVLAYRYAEADLPCIARMVAALRQGTTARVFVIGRKQFGWNNSAAMLTPEPARFALRTSLMPEAVRANAAARRLLPPDVFIDVERLIIDDQGRVPVFTPDHQFIAYDLEHLTPAGARWLGSVLFAQPGLADLRAGKHR